MKGKGKTILFYFLAFAVLLAIGLGLWLSGKRNPIGYAAKPVIYLYPEEETQVSVTLELDGKLTTTYPLGERSDRASVVPAQPGPVFPSPVPFDTLALEGGTGRAAVSDSGTSSVSWQVIAQPDGTLIDASGNTYSYLYWEGETDTRYDLSKGFVVKGEDSADFLREKLSYMGLTPREYNEFIVYWLPRLEANEYNLITFQGGAYTDSARLQITPEPDSLLRVFMAFKPLSKPVDIPEQELTPFTRTGFTVIEWGGCELK